MSFIEEIHRYCQIPVGTPVLVTGATGFTGAVLTEKLAAAGLQVHAISRSSSNRQRFHELNIQWHIGDVFDEQVVKSACENVEYIFHVAAAFREAKLPDSGYHDVHVRSTQLLAHEALKSKNFKRFIHVSTMGVHGHIENPPGDELSPYAPGDIYQETKLEAEHWLREFASQARLPFTIIRPTGIFGPGDRRLLKVFKMAARPIFPVLGYGKCLYHLIHVDDLTNAIMLAATQPKALGEAFIIGNDSAISLLEMAQIISKHLGKMTRIVRIPAAPFFVLGDICELLCRPFGMEPPIYRRRVAFFTKDRSFNTKKMKILLGFQPKYSNETGILMTTDWYIKQGWIESPLRRKTEQNVVDNESYSSRQVNEE